MNRLHVPAVWLAGFVLWLLVLGGLLAAVTWLAVAGWVR